MVLRVSSESCSAKGYRFWGNAWSPLVWIIVSAHGLYHNCCSCCPVLGAGESAENALFRERAWDLCQEVGRLWSVFSVPLEVTYFLSDLVSSSSMVTWVPTLSRERNRDWWGQHQIPLTCSVGPPPIFPVAGKVSRVWLPLWVIHMLSTFILVALLVSLAHPGPPVLDPPPPLFPSIPICRLQVLTTVVYFFFLGI